jgi:hypothetical protein
MAVWVENPYTEFRSLSYPPGQVNPAPMTEAGSIKEPYTGTQMEDEMNKNLLKTVFNGIAAAMGVAVVVLNIVNPLTLTGAPSLLAIGVLALGIAGLQKE